MTNCLAFHPQDAAHWIVEALPQGLDPQVEVMGLPADGPSLLELECGVRLRGGLGGLLVLRCARVFAADLAEASSGRALARLMARQALAELAERVAKAVLDAGLLGRGQAEAVQPAEALRVWDWPQRQPEVELLLLAGGQPLELRLWVEAGHA